MDAASDDIPLTEGVCVRGADHAHRGDREHERPGGEPASNSNAACGSALFHRLACGHGLPGAYTHKRQSAAPLPSAAFGSTSSSSPEVAVEESAASFGPFGGGRPVLVPSSRMRVE